jgi:hypothetical protein
VLRSDGGSLLAGINIGRLIRLRNYATIVPSGARCASACAFAWLGGSPRYMASDAFVGFHAAYRVEGGRAAESGAGNALLGAYLNQIGLNEAAIFYITRARPDQMTWLTLAEATKYGIEVQSISAEPASGTAASASSVEPAAPVNNLEQRTREFVVSLFAQWSSPSLDVRQLVGASYGEQVQYYGKMAGREDLIADKRQFVQRWPLRRYIVREPSLGVHCEASRTCSARAMSDWATFNPQTMARARGVAEVQYSIDWSTSVPRIVAEHGKVVERSKEPAAIQSTGHGWWVIMGAYKIEGPHDAVKVETDVRWTQGRAYLCGVSTISDATANLEGLAPGYKVVVAGPLADRAAAYAVKEAVRTCTPTAYVKQATRKGP